MNKQFNITSDLFWVGALDPNLKIFDIIMETEFGTTYNSYVLKGTNGIAIFETVKDKFFDEYLEKLKTVVDPSAINYIIVNHTEPDHVGSVARLLDYSKDATVVGSAQAIKFLNQIVNAPFKSHIAKETETLSLGNKTLRFISAPFLHWPDTIYTYIEEDKVLITCDSFGAHYCDEKLLKSALPAEKEEDFLSAYKYYFDMIMGPFKPFVLSALDKIKDLELAYICPGHGMILDASNMNKYIELYRTWATPQKRDIPSIVIGYVSAYGYTAQLAQQIKAGIESTAHNVDVLFYDLQDSDLKTVCTEITSSSGFLLGSPTIAADTLPQIWQVLSSLNPYIHKGIKASCFGSYGWSGEAVKNIQQRLTQLRLAIPVEPLSVLFKPSETDLETAFDFGVQFANKVL
ncbi:FprA family A-type flavoprotein [Cellulosilyticum sp. I15G10I2]|uniref:FprA family A-type flavoprotein n=1 Tax=Cellulosilyticum sp. I15G10I2 TaxID=1892843 RepID=UPI00085C31D6|nr:FprA family A-type flavoprotein [Cellulosilyticum sp. I15G10I2]